MHIATGGQFLPKFKVLYGWQDGLRDAGLNREGTEIGWETLAAIGAVTGSAEFMTYAGERKGDRAKMWKVLEDLKRESPHVMIVFGDHIKVVTRHVWEAYLEIGEDVRHRPRMGGLYKKERNRPKTGLPAQNEKQYRQSAYLC